MLLELFEVGHALACPGVGVPARQTKACPTLRHHRDSTLGDVITHGEVRLRVETDYAGIRDPKTGVNDGAADPAVPPDLDPRHQNRILHLAITVHSYPRGQNAMQHPSAGNDAAGTHNRVHRHSHTAAFLGEYELRRGLLRNLRPDRPMLVIQVKL